MRGVAVLMVIAAVAVVPGAARADEQPLCTLAGDASYQSQLMPYLGSLPGVGTPARAGIIDAARSVLGSQYASSFMDNANQKFGVAFAPRPLDATAAAQGIHDYLAAIYTPADMTYLDTVIRLQAGPYSEADLNATRAAVVSVLEQNPGLFSGTGISCFASDAFRVEVGVNGAETPELRARVDALLAPFGDRVRARYGALHGVAMPLPGVAVQIATGAPTTTTPPNDTTPAKALRVRDYVTLARTSRCVQGRRLTVKAAKTVKSIAVTAAGTRKLTLKAGKRGVLRLAKRTNKVTITVTLKDGRTATQTLRYRRC
jgi:hypothetical protein